MICSRTLSGVVVGGRSWWYGDGAVLGRNDRKLQHYLAASAESGEQLASGGSQIRSVFNDFLVGSPWMGFG